MRFRAPVLLAAASVLLLLGGCSRLVVESDPPGAQVFWSPNGTGDWRPWPPAAWAGPGDPAPTTPLRTSGNYQDTIWITVEKEGFHRPLPQPAQLYALRRERLRFQLAETEAATAARLRAEGFVRFRGEWVLPEDAGLVEFEGEWMPAEQAFRRQQIARGLVEYEGEWMTREERDERFAADQRARGLVLFKDRWITEEAREREMALDEFIQAIDPNDTIPIELPRVVGIPQQVVQVDLLNATSVPVRWILAGPATREVLIGPYESYRLMEERFLILDPGRYTIVAEPAIGGPGPAEDPQAAARRSLDRDARRGLAEVVLSAGFQYQFTYDGGVGFDLGDLEEYRVDDVQLPIQVPTIETPQLTPRDQPERPTRPGGPQGGGPPGGGGRGGGGGGGGGR